MKNKDVKALLIALNSTGPSLFKYPIGNVELTNKIKALEDAGRIKFDIHYSKWLFVR